MAFMKEFEHLKIQLEDIKSATDNFGENKVIGGGGFGKVYKGELSYSMGRRSMVAFKRLDRKYGQGDPEFWKEIMMLSRYKQQNLISLLGFCNEGGEMILVYEYASNGSLDRHLSNTSLTWSQRIKICLDAARGLCYLHDANGTQQRVLHRDIKSANILLDDKWNAKVSDMGLSKIGPANLNYSYVFTNIVGTPGYCDPQYMKTYILTKESDVYSFGVVLFEVLCGRLCFESSNGQFKVLVPMWIHSYQHKKLAEIIFHGLAQPMDSNSFDAFSDIAFQCLHESREERPPMSVIVEKLEIALKFQERHDLKVPEESTSSSFVEKTAYSGSDSSRFSIQTLSLKINLDDWSDSNIIPFSELLQLKKLEKIKLWRSKVEEVFEIAPEGTNSGSNDSKSVVKLPNLTTVFIFSCQGLKYIWKSNEWAVFDFPNLTTVTITDCPWLEHVFTSSMVGSLLQLQDLTIGSCSGIEVIVKEEAWDAKVKEVVLPSLKSLTLQYLENLKGFCLGKDDFSCPLLNTFNFIYCPAMEVFTRGHLATPELKVINKDWNSYDLSEDLNSFIKNKHQEGASSGKDEKE